MNSFYYEFLDLLEAIKDDFYIPDSKFWSNLKENQTPLWKLTDTEAIPPLFICLRS